MYSKVLKQQHKKNKQGIDVFTDQVKQNVMWIT